MSAIHLPVGGSTASRTINCPAWLERAKRMPKPRSNKYADEGNLLHDALEEHFLNDTPFEDMIGSLAFAGIELNSEHLPLLNACKEQAESVMETYNVAEFTCEPFVQLKEGEIGGSIDFVGVSEDYKTVVLLDYKTGQNAVRVKGNEQLLFYGSCAQHDKKTADLFAKAEKLALVIVQPKVWDEPKVWEQPVQALAEFKSRLEEALANPDRAAPGSHCQYCPAAPICPERKQQARAALLLEPKTSNEVAEALEMALSLEVWVKQVKDQAEDLAFQGARLPGFKLVRGKSNRRYTKEAEAGLIAELGEAAYSRKLIPITEAEKKLGRGVLEDRGWAEKPDGKLVLVPETDKREAVPVQTDENLKKFVDKISSKN